MLSYPTLPNITTTRFTIYIERYTFGATFSLFSLCVHTLFYLCFLFRGDCETLCSEHRLLNGDSTTEMETAEAGQTIDLPLSTNSSQTTVSIGIGTLIKNIWEQKLYGWLDIFADLLLGSIVYTFAHYISISFNPNQLLVLKISVYPV